jgi:hypothetical protein
MTDSLHTQHSKKTPAHLADDNCYICGYPEHPAASGGHTFWSNADARRYFQEEDRKHQPQGPSPEARYVAEYRPY